MTFPALKSNTCVTKLLYIAGCTHSGSTLTGRILNQHPQVFCAGELQHLDNCWGPTGRACACGEHIVRCPVWGRVFWKIRDSGLDSVPIARVSDERTMEWKRALSGHYKSRRGSRFGEGNRVLFDAIADVTGACVIVDTSKSQWRLLPLWRELDNVFVLHLVRDPAGFVASRIRDHRRSFYDATFQQYLRINLQVGWMFGKSSRYMKLRFEDLVRAPERAIESVFSWIGLPPHDPFTGEIEPPHEIRPNMTTIVRTADSLRPDPTHLFPDHDFRGMRRLLLRWIRRITY